MEDGKEKLWMMHMTDKLYELRREEEGAFKAAHKWSLITPTQSIIFLEYAFKNTHN